MDRMSFRVSITWLCILFSANLLLAGDLETVQARGKLVMLCVPHQESIFIRTKADAGVMPRVGTTEQFAGADVELMAGFAELLGVDLEIRPAIGSDGLPSYNELISSLLRGDGDLAASSLSVTPAREAQIEFSVPYFIERPVVVVQRKKGLKSVKDLEGKKAGTISGSSHEEHLIRLGFKKEDIRYAGFMLENILAVDEGDVDFTVVDSRSAYKLVPRFKNLKIAFELDGEDPYAVAVRPGSDLKSLLDKYLEGARQSGRVTSLIQQQP
ncbi:MAG: transporter substrate-binding domain-containing protein [bacterium]|nr:transporter substrate-binding domain-containing protein [bacterium]